METKKNASVTSYGIDIETPEGKVISLSSHEEKSAAIDIEPPEGFSVEEGETQTRSRLYEIKELSADEKKREHMGMRAKNIVSNTIIYVVLSVMTVIWLLPFVFIVLESFKCETTMQTGYIWPKEWGFDNYVTLFTNPNIQFGKWFLNTFIMGVVVSIVQTAIVLSVSYSLSRTRFKGRKTLMNFMLVLGMFPGFLTLILIYNLLSDWGLTESNSIWGLILVYVGSSGMGYYVSKGFFDTIPKSLDEAARVDGATQAQIFIKVILPMAKPIVIYTVLMGFMSPWGDFVLAKYIAHNDNAGFNVAVGLQWMLSTPASKNNYYTVFCAGGVVVAIPITLLFLFLQKYYVEGVTGGAVKG